MTYKRFLITYFFMAIFFGMSIFAFLIWQRSIAKNALIDYFHECSGQITSKLIFEPPKQKIKKERYDRAAQLLGNNNFDKDVVILDIKITTDSNDKDFLCLGVEYVDETAALYQINYKQDINRQGCGNLLLCPYTYLTRYGVAQLNILFKLDEKLADSNIPSPIRKDERVYLYISPKLFEDIVNKRGQIIFLGHDGSVLDRANIKDFD